MIADASVRVSPSVAEQMYNKRMLRSAKAGEVVKRAGRGALRRPFVICAGLLAFVLCAGLLSKGGTLRFRTARELQQTAQAQVDAPADSGASKKGKRDRQGNGEVNSVTIPVTAQPRGDKPPSELQAVPEMTVIEDGAPQQILSIRGSNRAPLALAVLIQDDLAPSVSNEIKGLAEFIRRQPPQTRVMTGYVRSGSLQVRQRFTTDLERAARSLRIPLSSAGAAPYNPYVEIIEALKRFDGQPTGRRAILIVSNGLDLSRGADSAAPTQSVDLQRAIHEAQRRGVAIYAIYSPAVGASGRGLLENYGQSSLNRLCDETGGQAFFQGAGAPVSFDPFLRDLAVDLSRQLAVTYLSTNGAKGFHRIQIKTELADNSAVKILHPAGYER